jgi:DNA-binding transcriptional regulator GbsR (MarR family)
MAEVHALLYITGEPLCADDIMERLSISRGNASMSLRALLDWGVVERTHRRGDRKEYFRAVDDVWAMFRSIVRERIKREVDPLLAALYDVREMTEKEESSAAREHNRRLDAMLDFFSTVERLSRMFASPSGQGLRAAATLLNRGDGAQG